MASFTEKMKGWNANETVRGLVPYFLFFIVLFLFNQRYDYVRTSLTTATDGLETRTMYLRQVGAGFCVGDMVRFASTERFYYRKVVAKAGAIFSLTDSGYQINGTIHPMKSQWLAKAGEELAGQADLIIPKGQVLFVNTEFNAANKHDGWAFRTVPRENVTDRVSHILFSKDFSRIGERVGTTDPDCIR